MGNQPGKGIPVAVIKDPKYQVFDQKDYNKFYQDPDHIMCSRYDNFDQFIQKQSLKNLHHIVIIQQHKQFIQSFTKVLQQNNQLVQYIQPIDNLISGRNQTQIRTRDKVINYIKKYSLDNINLYIYVKEFKSFIIPQYQVPYVTLVSTTSQIIINHILNQTTQNMVSVKFRSLVKDLYRKKLVVVISKQWKQKDKSSKNQTNNKLPKKQDNKQITQKSIGQTLLQKMQKNFKQNNFQYLFVNSTQKLSQKLKSMYFQFMICVDQQDLLEIIEFKKKMPIQSKLIYYGTQKDFNFQKTYNNKIDEVIMQKKKKQIWWISNDLQNQISPVMKKWWNAKTQSSKNNKIAKNVVILITKCQNIIQKKYVKQQLLKKLVTKGIIKQNKDKSSTFNINIQHNIQNIYKRLRNDLYTIVIMFDTSYQQFQKTKKIIMSKIKSEPRMQLSLVQLKKQTQNQKKSYKEMLDCRIQECSNKSYYQFKQQVSPIETINCLNLSIEEHEYFSYKMGLQVNVLQPFHKNYLSYQLSPQQKQKKLYKILQNYFPKILSKKVTADSKNISTESNKLQQQSQQLQYQLWSAFENFYIVCSFDDYLKYLFPYLVLANFYDKKQHTFQLPSPQYLQQIMNYLNRIKVIIYSEIEYDNDDSQRHIGLKELLRIHQNPAQSQKYIKQAIYEFLQIIQQNDKDINNPLSLFGDFLPSKAQKQTKKKQASKSHRQLEQKIQQQQKKQESLKKLFQYIETRIHKPFFNSNQNSLLKSLLQNEAKTQVSFPNIDFVHFKLSEIESHLKLCKYNQLSFSFFPKGSLKEFHSANNQIECIKSAKTFIINGNFGSNNDQLKKIFEKNVEEASTHSMQFVKMSKIIEQKKYQTFIKKYSGLWKLSFEVMKNDPLRPQYWQFNEQSLQLLKQGIIRAFKRSKNYQLLKVSSSEFKTFYIDRIQSCKNLLDLLIAVIYIYSLPHGMSNIVTAIFEQNSRSTLSLEIFIQFLFVLFLNFYSFHSRKLQKVQTVIYTDEKQMKNLYQYIKEDEILFNNNILHLMDNQNNLQNQKNHCIFIQYQNVPYMKQSSLSAMLQVQGLSFYKQSAQYLLAPFSKLILKKKQIIDGKYKLYFEVAQDNQSNLFLKSFFQLNKIDDIGIFKGLDQSYEEQQSQRLNQQKIDNINMEKNKQKTINIQEPSTNLMKSSKTKKNKNMIMIQPKSQNKVTSLYRQAQQIGLSEQKKNVQFSIRLNISFMKMLTTFNKNRLFTAEKYLQLLYTTSQTENNTKTQKQVKRFQLVKQSTQLKKLAIYQAMIYAKRHQFNKAINELNQLLEFMRLEKTQDKGDWIKIKIIQLRNQILRVRSQRHYIIKSIEDQYNKRNINNNYRNPTLQYDNLNQKQDKLTQFNSVLKPQEQLQNKQKYIKQNQSAQTMKHNMIEIQHAAIKKHNKRPQKWKVNFDMQNETFIMTKINRKNQTYKNKKVKSSKRENHTTQIIKQVYDLYCKNLFDQNSHQINQNYLTEYNHLISGLSIRNIGNQSKENNKQNNQLELNLNKTIIGNLNKTIIGRFFKQLSPKQFDLIKLLHLFMMFRNKIIMLDMYTNSNKREIREKLKQISSSYLLQKFQQWVLVKHTQFIQQIEKKQFSKQKQLHYFEQQTTIKQYGFIVYLKNTLLIENFQSIRQQLLCQYQFKQKTNISNKQKQNNNLSWIDQQLMEINPQSKVKWSVFQFQGKMVTVDSNRKWKQKINTNKKHTSKIFKRGENQFIQNQKAKRQKEQNKN